jgi:transcriptional regulator with XRE-family HTH domain
MNYAKRIKDLRENSRLTQEKLARAMGLETPNFISQIERVGLSVITKFCNAIGIELADFFREAQEQIEISNSIPVIDMSSARVDNPYDSDSHISTNGGCSIERPPDIKDKYAYGAIVRDKNMYPALDDNDVVIVSPSRKYKNNEMAIVGLANNEVLIRKIRPSDDLLVLECCNPAAEAKIVRLRDVKFVHPVLWVRYKMPLSLLPQCKK